MNSQSTYSVKDVFMQVSAFLEVLSYSVRYSNYDIID